MWWSSSRDWLVFQDPVEAILQTCAQFFEPGQKKRQDSQGEPVGQVGAKRGGGPIRGRVMIRVYVRGHQGPKRSLNMSHRNSALQSHSVWLCQASSLGVWVFVVGVTSEDGNLLQSCDIHFKSPCSPTTCPTGVLAESGHPL